MGINIKHQQAALLWFLHHFSNQNNKYWSSTFSAVSYYVLSFSMILAGSLDSDWETWGKWQISLECWLNLAESIGEQNLTLLPMFHCKHGPCNEKRYSLCPQGKHVCITGILFLLNTMCLPCTCVCILRQKDWETTLILSLQSFFTK